MVLGFVAPHFPTDCSIKMTLVPPLPYYTDRCDTCTLFFFLAAVSRNPILRTCSMHAATAAYASCTVGRLHLHVEISGACFALHNAEVLP